MTTDRIAAVAFDCYGTLVDFGDEAFARAYGQICAEQSIPIDGQTFYDTWMAIWRRLAASGASSDLGSVGALPAKVLIRSEAGPEQRRRTEHPERLQSINQPGPLSEPEAHPERLQSVGIPPHPQHHTPSAGRSRGLDGPAPPYRPYREEWPEHFALCFEELGVRGDSEAAYDRLRQLIAAARAFPESRRVVEFASRRLPVALLSNADDDFLRPCLARNGLVFPVVVSSETARVYKPHASIFRTLSAALGVSAGGILYVGDSRFADVVGAKHAGLQAAWVNRPGAGNRSLDTSDRPGARSEILDRFPPDFEIDSLDAVLAIISARPPTGPR